ncbi:MAG: hypothetical protein HY749_04345, partial [Gammaproteobacteria bacterium]|nr:hypothetical protein [Gammaproteobacteria bacterium]
TLDLQSGTANLVHSAALGTFGALGLDQLSGTIKNGRVNGAGTSFTSSSGILDAIILDGDLTDSAGTLQIDNTLTLADAVTLTMGANQLRFDTAGASILTATPGVTHSTVQFANGSLYNAAGGTGTIGQGVTVQGYGTISTCCVGGGAITNAGTIDANAAGAFSISPGTFTNNGTVLASTGTVNITPTTFANNGALQVTGGTLSINPGTGSNWTTGGSIAMSNGTLSLGGLFDHAGLLQTGTFTRGAGTLTISGTMDLGGQTLDVSGAGPLGTGGLNQLSGTLSHGHLAGAGFTLNSNGGLFDTITLDNSLTTTGSVLYVDNALALGNGVTLDLGGTQLRLNNASASVNTVTPGTTTSTLQMTNGTLYEAAGSTGTIGQGVTVQGSGTISSCCAGSGTILNNGTILANNGGTLTVSPTTFTNSGTVSATGGTLNIVPTTFNSAGAIVVAGGTLGITPTNVWTNGAGSSIDESSGILNLGGTISFAGLLTSGGAFSRSGGTLNFTGVMDLGGSTLDLTNGGPLGSGGLNQLSGTISNGHFSGAGVSLNFSSGVLSDITLDNSMTATGSILYINNALTLGNGVTLDLGGTQLRLNNAAAGISTVTPGTTTSTLQMTNGTLYEGAGSTGTIGQGVTVQGSGTISSCCAGSGTILNNGTILANNGGTLTVSPTTFTNSGTVSATSGTLNIVPTTFNSAGAIVVAGGTLGITPTNVWTNGAGSSIDESSGILNLGGSFTRSGLFASGGAFTRNGGTLNVTGAMNLGGGVLDLSGAGPFGSGGVTQLSGSFVNGHLAGTGVTLNSNSGLFDTITLDNSLTATGSILYINNALTLGNGVLLDLGNTQLRLNNAAAGISTVTPGTTTSTVQMTNGTLYEAAGSTGTIGQGVTIQGYGTISSCCAGTGTIANNGTISATVPGQTLFINPLTFTNTGSVLASAGATVNISPSNAFTNNGLIDFGAGGTLATGNHSFTNAAGATLRGSGTINLGADFTFTNNGTLSLGTGASGTTGMLSITGNLALGATSVLAMEAGGPRRALTPGYDSINVSGTTTLGGTLSLSHLAGYTPVAGDSFLVVSSGGALGGTWGTLSTPVAYNAQYAAKDAVLQVGASAIPVNVWDTDSNGLWSAAANWSLGHVPLSSEIVLVDRGTANPLVTVSTGAQVALRLFDEESLTISGGSLDLGGASYLGTAVTLTLSGGTLQGAGAVSFDGLGTWSAGNLGGTGAGSFTVGTGAELDVTSSGNTKNVAGGYTLATAGTGLVKLFSSGFNLSGANFTNAGTLQMVGDYGIGANGGTNLFTNTGNVLKSAGTVASIIGVPLADANGTWTDSATGQIQLAGGGSGAGTFTFATSTGALAFTSGTFALNDFTAAAGDGVLVSGGTVSVAGTATLPATTTLTLSAGSLGGAGTINLAGLGTWSGGSLGTGAGTFDVLTGGELDITTGGAKNVTGGYTLATTGTGLVKLVSGSFNLGGGNFTNAGTFQMAGDFGIQPNGGTNLFTNTGSVLKSAGAIGSPINVPIADTNGTWTNAASGPLQLFGGGTGSGTFNFAASTGSLAFSSGTFTLDNLTAAAGNAVRVNGGTVIVNGMGTLPGTLALSSGNLGGAGTIDLSGLGTWSGGNLGTGTGTFDVLSGGELDVTTAGLKNVNGGYTLATTGTGVLKLVSGGFSLAGGTVTNAGTLDFVSDWSIAANGGTNLLTNTGTMLKSGGPTYSAIGVPIADVNGTWSASSGAFGLDGGGTGAGTFAIASNAVDFRSGTFTLNSLVNAANWWISGGNMTINGTASVPGGTTLKLSAGSLGGSGAITVGGIALWDGGNFGGGIGSLTTTGGGTLTVGTPAALKNVIGGYTLATTSTGNLVVNANFSLAGGNVVNAGTLDLAGDFGIAPNGGTNSLANSGTILKSAGTGTSALGVPVTSNTGTIRIETGTIAATGANAANAGVIDVWNGAVFQTSGSFGNGPAGTLRGSGTVDVGLGNTLTNNGTLAPDSDLVAGTAATLHVNGNYAQAATGIYSADLGGTANGSYDVIAATGAVTLGGTITGTLIGGYTPANGDALNVVTGTSVGSDFTTKTLPGTFSGAAAGSAYTLTYGTPAGCAGGTICFDNTSGDFLWGTLANWSTDTLPILTDDVYINLTGPITVTLGSGVHAINSLNFANGDTLFFSGGTLAIAGALTGTGNVTISGGTLAANGTTTLAGALTVNSGSATFAGAGPNSVATLAVNGGTATFNTAHSVGGITLGGGNLAGTGAVVLTGLGTWSGGSFGNGGGSFTVGSGGELDVTTAANGKQVANYTLGTTGTGLVKLVSSGFSLSNGAFTNAGTFELAGDYALTSGGGTNDFSNTGALVKSGGAATGTIGVPMASNAGMITVSAGTLDVSGMLSSNTGTIDVASAATLKATGAFTNGVPGIGGGTLRGAGTIDVGGTNTLTNHGTIAPGTGGGTAIGDLTIDGNLVNTATAMIAANVGGTSRGVSYDALDVTGSATLAGTLGVTTTGGFVAANNDQFQIVTATGGLSGTPGSASLPANYTAQTQSNDEVLTYFACAGAICFDNSAGDGLWSNALNWTGDILPGLTDNVVIDLPGTSTVTLGSGTQTIASLFVNTGNVLDFTGGALTVNGATTIAGALSINGGGLTLHGTTQIASYAQASGSADFGGTSTVASFAETGGAFSGAGRLTVTTSFSHTGGTHSGSGTTVLGPAITFAPGASYAFGRNFEIDGTLVQGGIDLDVATGNTLRLAGSWTWSSGAVTGGGTVVTTGASALSGAGLKSFAALSWQNRGTIVWTGGTLDAAGVIDNQSGGVCQASLTSGADQMSGAGAFLNEAGATFVKTAGPQLDVLLPFTNAGTLVVNGTLRLARDFTNQGLMQLGTNGELLADPQAGGPAIAAFGNGAAGTIKGNGTIDVGSYANVTFGNAGLIAPGNSPGTIVIVGNFAQLDTGKLLMDIGGYNAGTQFDLLSVTGTATLGGTLELELLGSFAPKPSDQFNLVGYAARAGDFATLVLPSGQSFTPDALPSFYRVSIAGLTAAPADPTAQVLVMPDVLAPVSGAAESLGAILGEAPIEYQPRRRGSSCQ